MKKLLLILFAQLCVLHAFSQSEASNWYFGFGAGIQFDLANGTVTSVNDGQLITNEGCVSISDSSGQLLFYSDGTTVYNRNHQIMPNGTGLLGSASATQSAIVVPAPGNDDLYYIFTVDTAVEDGIDLGFNYSIVDMSLDGGLGDVTTKNVNLLANCSEKISAVLKDCVDESVWVITLASPNGDVQAFDTFHAFEVNTTGIVTTPVSSTVATLVGDKRGYLKLSPNGNKLVSANVNDPNTSVGGLFIYDFDQDTGVVSNEQRLVITSNNQSNHPYGVEFSPNSQYLYVHSYNDYFNFNDPTENNNPDNHTSTLTQFDLFAADIQASEFTLDQRNLYRGGLQLGPDGKIYRALAATYEIGTPFLGVIHNPNAAGAAANYEHDAIALDPNTSSQGLPPFIQSFFDEQIDIIQNGESTSFLNLCDGDTYTLMADDIPNAIYTWTLDGAPLPETDFDLVVTAPGHYEVIVEPTDGTCEILEGEAFVSYFQVPVANPAQDLVACDTDNNGAVPFDFVTTTTEILGAQDPATFQVKYYVSQEDADNNENAVSLPFSNTTNPQQIFARIDNIDFNDCFDTTSFMVEVFDTPTANPVNDLDLCDDDLDGDQQNGQVTTDLSALSPVILGTQDAMLFDISFHSSQADANNNANPLPLFYYNTTPFSEEVFVRIENNQNTDCYDTTSFFIIVNALPTANPISDIDQCDDNNDGFYSFNFNDLVDNEVLGTQDPSTFNVRYFSSQADADNGTNALAMPFQTTTNPQTIVARIEHSNNSDCFDTTSFTINVFNTPTANAVNDQSVCDDDTDGNDTNGQVTTDLSQFNDVVLNGQDAIQYTITYHSSQTDAENGNNALPLSYYNTFSSEEIWVRIENNLNTNCYDTTSFNLTVNIIPESCDATLFQCDEDGNVDGFTLFNLTEAHDALSCDTDNRSTRFFLSLADAQAGTNEIDGISFSNTSNPQTVYAQVINNDTGCFRTAELVLEVSTTTANGAQLFACDDDGVEDGLFEFTLSDTNADVLNGLPAGLDLSFYATYEDALLELNALPDNYTNTTPYFQVIYVRVEDDNACYGINEVELTVWELPDIEIEEERIYCLNAYPETIVLSGGITNDDPNNYTYDWSTGESTPEIEVNEADTYTVLVTTVNGCSKLRTITVLNSNIATIDTINVVDVSDNNTITVNVSGEGDYEYALDDINGPYQDSNLFENVSPGIHTVYIRDKNACGIMEQQVSVVGFMKFFTPNGDGYFDTWRIIGSSEQFQSNAKIYIFDRYGKLLKQLDPKGEGWDGTFNGRPLPDSDYWFQITLEDGRIFRNHFALKR